jgi:hypothetical protein
MTCKQHCPADVLPKIAKCVARSLCLCVKLTYYSLSFVE